MGTRIEIELTSVREDGNWTWRAAGARQPRGTIDAELLYEGAKVGDVVRADAEFEVDGITVLGVLAPRGRKRSEPERLEILTPASERPLVTSSLVGRRRGGPRHDRGRPEGGPDGRGRREPRGDGPRRADRGARGDGPRRADRGARGDHSARGDHPARADRGARTERESKARPKRFNPPSVRRAALLAELGTEERLVAEQLLRGGLPAVRQAVREQDAAARAAGRPAVTGEPLMAMAERLLPRVREAAWLDRAEAATKILDEISLRDLRSVVVGADVARDDASRLLAGTLREALNRKVAERREEWTKGVASALDEGRVVRALRESARPPDPAARLSADLATRLRDSAGAALSDEAPPDRWLAVLEATAASPVRRVVRPGGLPAHPGTELLEAARRHAGHVPALAPLLGIKMPPPPGPPKPRPGTPRQPPAGVTSH